MNAPARFTSADITRTVDAFGERQDARLRAQLLASNHLAELERIPSLTDNDATLFNARNLAKRIGWLAANADAGMLGANGVAPQVASLVWAAKFHGFREVRS